MAKQLEKPAQQPFDIGVMIFRAHRPRDPTQRNRPAQITRQLSSGCQQPLGMKAPIRRFIVWLWEGLAKMPFELAIVILTAQRPANRARHEQIALDMPTTPGEDLEPLCCGGLDLAQHVAIEDAEASGLGVEILRLRQLSARTVGLATAKNHRGTANAALEARRDRTRPSFDDRAVSSALDEQGAARMPRRNDGPCGPSGP